MIGGKGLMAAKLLCRVPAAEKTLVSTLQSVFEQFLTGISAHYRSFRAIKG